MTATTRLTPNLLPDSALQPDFRRPSLAITYGFIEGFEERQGCWPTIFQIAKRRRQTYQTTRDQLQMMHYRGWIYRDVGKGRFELNGVS